ncbi:MAG: hypothetical protein CMI54_04275 [Parcubacteria group bacterium]|nr:hypothetical protein [Parcubacteria group bacterium]|tara:strand:+ start:6900 stop:7790 length:891 start_codon:yes stop_codon:yes gene_type:complete
MADQVAQESLRGQFFDKVIKQTAKRAYKFKQAVSIVSTGAWRNFFYRETTDVLTGATGNLTKGIPRGAEFPQASGSWDRIETIIEKYGLEDNIPWEDLVSDEIDVRDRTLIKIAEGVTKAVDDEIWAVLSDSGNALANKVVQTIDVGGDSMASKFWDVASAAIIDDLLQAKQLIAEENYDVGNLMAFVSPKDYRSINNYLAGKGAQFPQLGDSVAANGDAGKLVGIKFVISNSVTASQAIVVVPKRCATWKELVALSTTTKEDPYKSLTIRSVEMGVTQLTDPKSVVFISGTQKPA